MAKLIAKLDIFYRGRLVGTLLVSSGNAISFSYAASWLENGFSLNPLSLPLNSGVFTVGPDYPYHLFGVFADSLPDSWGRILLSRFLRSRDLSLADFGPLAPLYFASNNGFGSLEYRPSFSSETKELDEDLDEWNRKCQLILDQQETDQLDALFCHGGSSGGSRPKLNIKRNGEEWIVKFPHRNDPENIGEMEFQYMQCAESCGIAIPEICLLPSKKGKGFYAVKRFDRSPDGKIHCVSASSLLERDFENALLDYNDLFKLVSLLCKNNKDQFKELYRRMCFNVFAKNQDDHGKNFVFLYKEEAKRWELAPAFDLTYSPTLFFEQSTSVLGKGKDIAIPTLVQLGTKYKLPRLWCEKTAQEIQQKVSENLSQYW